MDLGMNEIVLGEPRRRLEQTNAQTHGWKKFGDF